MAACFALAAVTLLLPSQPSYDPWAWLHWGRELTSLDLDTRNGPSWKPLPVAFTLVFAPLASLDEGVPPALWLLTARAAALLALVLAFRVAWRLAGRDRRVAAGAGVIASVALLLSPDWLRYMAHGNEAPMAVAFMLAAVDRQLDGAGRHALVLGFLASLLRPEIFPFLAGYAVLVWSGQPAARRLIAGLALLLPILWLVPEWVGSGDPLGAAHQARSEPSWSLSLEERPWLAVLERWQEMVGVPLEAGALLGIGFALRRQEHGSLALAALAAAWLALVILMTQAGFSGNGRYLLPPVVIASLLAGCGAARMAAGGAALAWRLAERHRAPRARQLAKPAGALAVTALVAVAVAPFLKGRIDGFRAQAASVAPLAALHRELAKTVDRLGGPGAVTQYGAPTVNRKFDTHLAWELEIPIPDVEVGQGDGIVFRAAGPLSGPAPHIRCPRRPQQRLVTVGRWRVTRAGHPAELTRRATAAAVTSRSETAADLPR